MKSRQGASLGENRCGPCTEGPQINGPQPHRRLWAWRLHPRQRWQFFREDIVSPPGAAAIGQMLALVWISANGHRSNVLFEKAAASHNPRRARVKTRPQRSSVSLAPRCVQPCERLRRFLEFILHFHTDQRHGRVQFVGNSPDWTLCICESLMKFYSIIKIDQNRQMAIKARKLSHVERA